MTEQDEKPKLVIVAGPNGSGKTTFIKEIYTRGAELPEKIINADDIARTQKLDAYAAAQEADRQRKHALENKQSFTTETVLSTPSKIELMKEARAQGYDVHLVYITTKTPIVNVYRVAVREANGGHGVPTEKIVARYERSMGLVAEALKVATTAEVFDNSLDKTILLVEKKRLSEKELSPEIIKNSVINKQEKSIIIMHPQRRTWTQERLQVLVGQKVQRQKGERTMQTETSIDNVSNVKNSFKQTELHRAALQGNVAVAQQLIAQGADINVKNALEETPLHLAVVAGHKEVTELLLSKGAHINSVNDRGATPLHEAANEGHESLVKLLVTKGADVNITTKGDDLSESSTMSTPLHMAAASGNKNIAEILIAAGANINAKDSVGNTPLHIAATLGHNEFKEVLLARGADITIKNNIGEKPWNGEGPKKIVYDKREGEKPMNLETMSAQERTTRSINSILKVEPKPAQFGKTKDPDIAREYKNQAKDLITKNGGTWPGEQADVKIAAELLKQGYKEVGVREVLIKESPQINGDSIARSAYSKRVVGQALEVPGIIKAKGIER